MNLIGKLICYWFGHQAPLVWIDEHGHRVTKCARCGKQIGTFAVNKEIAG